MAPRPGRHGRLRLASDISGLLRANALKLVEWSPDWAATLELREPQHWHLGFRVKSFSANQGLERQADVQRRWSDWQNACRFFELRIAH